MAGKVLESRIDKAMQLREKGYNCCQAVVCCYCDLFGFDEKDAFMIGEGFGAGIGDMKNVCGAVSGAVMLAGMKTSCGNLSACNSKATTYEVVKQITAAFQEKNQSLICRELKGLDTGSPLRSCNGCVEDCCRLVEELLLG